MWHLGHVTFPGDHVTCGVDRLHSKLGYLSSLSIGVKNGAKYPAVPVFSYYLGGQFQYFWYIGLGDSYYGLPVYSVLQSILYTTVYLSYVYALLCCILMCDCELDILVPYFNFNEISSIFLSHHVWLASINLYICVSPSLYFYIFVFLYLF